MGRPLGGLRALDQAGAEQGADPGADGGERRVAVGEAAAGGRRLGPGDEGDAGAQIAGVGGDEGHQKTRLPKLPERTAAGASMLSRRA